METNQINLDTMMMPLGGSLSQGVHPPGGEATDEVDSSVNNESSIGDAGEDVTVTPDESLTVITAVMAFKKESEQARRVRDQLNLRNYNANLGVQDWSNKVEGQSTMFIPKTSTALQQICAFVKKGLVGFGNWFQVDLSPDPTLSSETTLLTPSSIVKLLRHRLEDPDELIPGFIDFPTLVSDAIMMGALGSLAIIKVHGTKIPTRRYNVEQIPMLEWVNNPLLQTTQNGTPSPSVPYIQQTGVQEKLTLTEGSVWRLLVELCRPEDIYLDPTNKGLYLIHRTYHDLHELIDSAAAGNYDPLAVDELTQSFSDYQRNWELEQLTDQPHATPPTFRKQVAVDTFWGTLLDSEGKVAHRNCVCAIANEKYLIKKPTDNPYWHQEIPYVVAPLTRLPFSTYHRAIFDNVVELNIAYNELYNLIQDGGIAAVHGIRQIKMSMVENADEFTDGIPEGSVLNVREEFPDGQPVMIQLRSGQVPQESLAVLNLIEKEFQAAAMVNDTKVGQLPRKEVRATEVAAANESSSVYFDSIISDLENLLIRPALRLAWLTILQNASDWSAQDVVGCIGPQQAKALGMLSSARRYALYALGTRFKVHGLSSTISRGRDFQKIMTVLSVVGQSPPFLQAFMKKYSTDKTLSYIFKLLNLDPEDLALSEEEATEQQQSLQSLPFFAGIARGAQGNQQPQMQPEQQSGNPVQAAQSAIASQNQPPRTL